MKGTKQQFLLAMSPLGDPKVGGQQIKYDCPHCMETSGSGEDKHNLECNYGLNKFHCWSCGYSGNLYKLVKERGLKDYAKLFKTEREFKSLEEENDESVIFELPKHTTPAYNILNAKIYLLSRGINSTLIRKNNIRYCVEGVYKDCIIFPSYEGGRLISFVTHNIKSKKYKNHRSDSYRGFYLEKIDKRFPIIITEGVYDALVVPNAIPLLGLAIKDELLDFLANSNVLLCLDNGVEAGLKKGLIKQLKSVCDSIKDVTWETKYKDINELYCKDKKQLTSLLKQYY